MSINRAELQGLYDGQARIHTWLMDHIRFVETNFLQDDCNQLQLFLPILDGYMEEIRTGYEALPNFVSKEDFEFACDTLQRLIDMSYSRLNAVLAELSSRGVHTST